MTDSTLTQRVKSFAFKEGASLVGIAPVSRWKNAPVRHSPQGVFPRAKSVVVCAIHIPDACVELGEEGDPRIPGPALVQVNVTASLNYLGFHVARFLEKAGWQSIPVSATGLWNYRSQPGADRGWMADICHYYAAACAGLGEIGWHNLCITPEFGARQRFISIITEAPLHPDPMYSGRPLCDRCLLCAKNCPTKSFDKEVCGKCSIEIEDKKYTFPKRNLWRCAIGENFQLDVLKEWPEKIDEEVIVKAAETAVTEHPEWIFGWKMGLCLKWCVNPQRRYFDKDYCASPRRRRDISPVTSPEAVKTVTDEVMTRAYEKGADFFAALDIEYLKEKGIDIKKELPDAAGAIVVGLDYPEDYEVLISPYRAYYLELLLANLLEKYGYSALVWSDIPAERVAALSDEKSAGRGKKRIYRLIITGLPVMSQNKSRTGISVPGQSLSHSALTARVKKMLYTAGTGADLAGIAPAARVEQLTSELNGHLSEDGGYFRVDNLPPTALRKKNLWGGQAMPFNPELRRPRMQIKKPSEYLEGAKAVVVAGMKLPDAVVDYAGRGEGAKAGHYQYIMHGQTQAVLSEILLDTANFLVSCGYRVVPMLNDTDSHHLTANRIAAISAGLGEIGWNGMALTPQYGPKQVFAAFVTDAPLDGDPLYKGEPLCKRCYRCAAACPARAISKETPVSVSVEGTVFTWGSIDRLRCDWACRYGLLGEAGPKYFNSKNNFPVPDNITPESVCESIRKSDRLQRFHDYTVTVERCFTECPAGKNRS